MASKVPAVKTAKYLLTLCVLTFAAYRWYQYAWTFEDSFITFRVIDNLVSGYGLRWNVAERVQVFTHPLWLFILTPVYALTREVVLSTAVVSAVCTLGTVIVIYKSGVYRSSLNASILVLLLFLTDTFPTYSSSGFENPLNHLLACLFSVLVLQGSLTRSPFSVALVAALGMVTRLDTALFYLPVLLAACISTRRACARVILGLFPIILWECFSLLYYGVFIPNTALAKIPHGIDTSVILRQGWAYVADLVSKDLIASAMIALAFLHILSVLSRVSRNTCLQILREPLVLLNLGTVLYCAYVVWVGGDYLSYRFWSLPLLTASIAALYWIERIDVAHPCVLSPRSFLAIGGLVCATQFFLSQTRHAAGAVTDIGDERPSAFFAPLTVSTYIRQNMSIEHAWKTAGVELRQRAGALHAEGNSLVSEQSTVGLTGYYAGPHAYIVDVFALTEPLLARLPVAGGWRIGHFPRQVPQGYLRWLEDGDVSKLDPILNTYLRTLMRITREPIFSISRLRIVLPFALGFYDRPLKSYVSEAVPNSKYIVPLTRLSRRTVAGTPWDDFNHVIIPPGAILEVLVDKKIDALAYEIALGCDDTYTIDFVIEGDWHFRYRPGAGACPGMVVVDLPVPSGAIGKLVKKILIYPSAGDGAYSVGHLIFKH
jgi:arabinofuranosyltransferase